MTLNHREMQFGRSKDFLQRKETKNNKPGKLGYMAKSDIATPL